MLVMSNQAYLRVWCKDFPEELILERFGSFLETVPFSTAKPGFTYFTVRAVDPTEVPVFEQDLRALPLDAAGVVELAQEHLHNDTSYEVRCDWDLWVSEGEAARWKLEPQPLEIYCHGEDYGEKVWLESGHFEANLGFEHLFTGHAGLLGFRRGTLAVAESPEEARFLEAMAWPENLQKYQDKTRENIRRLLDWTRKIEKALPVERIQLWSEGEENFEARLEEILAAG
jgi:hypothetical protein